MCIIVVARRSHENSGSDVTSRLYSHWSVLNSNLEEVKKQLEKRSISIMYNCVCISLAAVHLKVHTMN